MRASWMWFSIFTAFVFLTSGPTWGKVAMWPDEAAEPVVVLDSSVEMQKATSEGSAVGVAVAGGVAVGGGTSEYTPPAHLYWIKAKNVSQKRIRAIEFVVDFYTPFDELYASDVIQVTSEKMRPKAWREFRVESEGVRHKQSDWHHKCRLRRVMFEDGTQWVAPDAAASPPSGR